MNKKQKECDHTAFVEDFLGDEPMHCEECGLTMKEYEQSLKKHK